ncbi:MAG: hypothetical protein HFJ50_00205 [Clostridia bacterium]|jgi:hypothetical protein|nr:hypothetical protein [Clostridia bacterium]
MINLIKDLQKSVSACGQVDIAKSLRVYNQELAQVSSGIEGKIGTIKEKMTGILSSEMVTNFEQIFTKTVEPTELLTAKLKEVESQLRACGETAKANKIKEYMQETQKKTINVDTSINELRADIEKCFGTNAVNDFNKKLNEADKKVKNVSKSSNFGSNLKTALGIGTVALGIRKAVGFFKEATTESIDFVETQNLFNVSMGKTVDQYGNLDREASKYYIKAMAFQEKLSDKLKINIEESMEYQALFNAMSKSMGIGDEPSYKISENFTKLGYDLSSLYNIDPENAMQKLRAGLSGQTKPLRDLGLDITQQSLEPLLDELGIERSTKQLSQAEKMIARYIVVLRQASLAHGDFAKTMDSPANQLRIFNAQITAFKRNMGNLWQGLLGNILPYVNAIMMVINELLKMVAKLFGFEVSDQNVNISAGVGADDLADDLGTATGKAKELKKQLMGFDEINNITLPDKTSGGSGGGASVGGIDKRLLDAMKEYDNLMDKVKSKATDIRDKILDWLGFTDGSYKNLNRILDVAKLIGLSILGWKIAEFGLKLKEILTTAEKLNNLKVKLGIALLVTGLFFSAEAFKELSNGNINGESIKNAVIGAVATGMGAGLITGGGLTLGIPLTITILVSDFLTSIDSKLGIDEKLWKPIYKAFGMEYSKVSDVSTWWIRVKLGVKVLGTLWNTLTNWDKLIESLQEGLKATKIAETITNAIKNLLLGVANAIENIPFVGKSIAEGIRNTLNLEWKETGTTIEYTTSEALKQANPWVMTNSERLGKNMGMSVGTGISNVDLTSNIDEFTEKAQKRLQNCSFYKEGQGMSNTAKKGFGSNSLNDETNELVNSAKTTLNQNSLSNESNKLAETIKPSFTPSIFNVLGKNIVEGIKIGINNNQSILSKAVSGLSNGIVGVFKNVMQINSPSKVMTRLASCVPEGIAKGINDNANIAYNSIKDLSKGLNEDFIINPNDFKIDTNQFIDYGKISGAIATQSNVNVSSDIEGKIENAIYRGLSNATIPVEIEATTDEGVIFKKIQVKAREFYTQTGEPAFDF